jgi:chemotaxis protein CheY-P-specific phosphatase CheC
MLSQEEIDALLSGAAFETPTPVAQPTQSLAPAGRAKPASASKPAGGKVSLDMGELKTLGERLKEGLGAAAEVSSTLLGRSMKLAPISIDMEDDDGLAALIAAPFVVFDFRFDGSAVNGPAALVMSTGDAAMLADLMMGGAGAPAGEELDDLHETAVKEAIGPLLNGLAGAIGRHVNDEVSIQDLASRQDGTMPLAGHGKRAFAQYTFDLEGLRSGSLHLVIDAATARAIAGLKAAPPVAAASAAPPKAGGVPMFINSSLVRLMLLPCSRTPTAPWKAEMTRLNFLMSIVIVVMRKTKKVRSRVFMSLKVTIQSGVLQGGHFFFGGTAQAAFSARARRRSVGERKARSFSSTMRGLSPDWIESIPSTMISRVEYSTLEYSSRRAATGRATPLASTAP